MPIKTGGARSKILFRIEQLEAGSIKAWSLFKLLRSLLWHEGTRLDPIRKMGGDPR